MNLREPFQYAVILDWLAKRIWPEEEYFPVVPHTEHLGHLFWELIMSTAVARRSGRTLVLLKPGGTRGQKIVNGEVFNCEVNCKIEREKFQETLMNTLFYFEKLRIKLYKFFRRLPRWVWPVRKEVPVMRFHRCGIEVSNFVMAKITGTKHYYDISLLPDSEPSLKLTADQRERARKLLAQAGFDDSKWFAAAHVREPGFRGFESYHDARNFSQQALLPLINQIVSRGGFMVRMGTREQSHIPHTTGLFDYAYSGIRSDLLDIYLMETSRFYLGASSGPHVIAWAFGKPAFAVNIVDFLVAGFRKSDMFIPKMIVDPGSLTFLSIQEYCSVVSSVWNVKEYWYVENNLEDIESSFLDFSRYVENGFMLDREDQELYLEWIEVRRKTLNRIIAESSNSEFDEGFKDMAISTLNAPAVIAPSYLRKYLFDRPKGFLDTNVKGRALS